MNLRVARRLDGVERTLIRQIFDSAPPGAINLGLGQPDLPTPPSIALQGVAAIAAERTGYTSTAGDPQLRAAVAARYPGWAEGPESVLITIGSQEAMFASCLALLDPGDELLYPDPGYPAYPVVARLLGARATAYPLRPDAGFALRADDVIERLSPQTRVVVVCSPSNPTGACNGEGETRRLVAALEERDVAWLSDEIYSGFIYEGRSISPAAFSRQGLVVSGLSKDLSMTGWRIGWVVGAPAIVARIIAVHQYIVTCASSISQAAAVAALGPGARIERERMLEIFRRRRQLMGDLLAAIPGVQVTWPSGAFYFFVDVSRFGSSLEVARRALTEQRVITIPGVAFGKQGEGYLRLSYAASENDITAGVRSLAASLERWAG